jgi:hypothetical protein
MITPLQPPPPGIAAEIHRALYEVVATLHVAEIEEQPGQTRIGEVHDYGILNGKPMVLFFQTSGYSRSGGRFPKWRHLDVKKVRAVRPLDKTFRGGRDTATGQHRQWDKLFIRAAQP